MATLQQIKETSRTGVLTAAGTMDPENLQLGAMLRIADATEKLVSNYDQLQRDLAYYKEWHGKRGKRIDELEKQLATAKGWNTRYKNKLKTTQQ